MATSGDGLLYAYLVLRDPSSEEGPWDLVVQDLLRGSRGRWPVGGESWVPGMVFFGGRPPVAVRFDGASVGFITRPTAGESVVELHDLSAPADRTLVVRQRTVGGVAALSGDLRTVLLSRPRVGPSRAIDFYRWRLAPHDSQPTHLPIDADSMALDRCGEEAVVEVKVALGPPLWAHINPLPYEVGRVTLDDATRYERRSSETDSTNRCPAGRRAAMGCGETVGAPR